MKEPVRNLYGLHDLYDWISIKTPPTENGRYFVAIKAGNDWHITIRRYSLGTACSPYPHWTNNTCGIRYWMPMFLLPPSTRTYYTRRTI